MPRAATTWLCKVLNEHPGACAFGETLFWGRSYVEPRGREGRYTPQQAAAIIERFQGGECVTAVLGEGPGCLKRVTRENLAAILAELPSQPRPGEMFSALCRAIARAEGKPHGIEKTPHHINWLDRIMRELPRAKVVITLREPYGFMLSYKHQGDRKREFMRKQFERRYHPLACALVWRGCLKASKDAVERYPDQVLLVQHEEIRRDPASVLDRVQEFFELSPRIPGAELAQKVPPDNTSFPHEARPELKADDVFWMNLIAGRAIAANGYARRPAPPGVLSILASLLRLPLWAVWNIFSMKRRVRGSILSYLGRWIRPARHAPAGAPEEAAGTRA